MKLRTRPSRSGGQRGIMLVDCLMYIALLAVILTLTLAAFYRTNENSKNLAQNAADIIRALNAGERWREDVRAATGPPRVEEDAKETLLQLPQAAGEVRYRLRDGIVARQTSGNTNWIDLLPNVKSSRMEPDPRRHVTAWRWELELQGRQKVARVKPLFTFQAVPAPGAKP